MTSYILQYEDKSDTKAYLKMDPVNTEDVKPEHNIKTKHDSREE